MNQIRPKNLNLFTIRFPIPAIVSILHRITGFALFLLIPLMIWCFSFSLTQEGFDSVHEWLTNPFVKFFFWLCLIPFCFHLVAGVRHLLMDIHVGSSLRGGRLSALLTFIISIILVLMAGVWLW